jgi:RHS repeat-associated protein
VNPEFFANVVYGRIAYSYDPVDRLTSATNSAQPNENYSFDGVGNRTASHLSASYGYQPFNKLTSTATATYSYDNNGNLLSKIDASGTTNFSWTEENQLKQVTLPNGVTVNYKYDALGRRIQRTTSGGANERYVYDGQDVMLDLNADWSVATTYLNDPGIDNHLRQTSATAGISYYLGDHLGSTAGLTDVSGNVLEQLSYDSFGNGAGSTRTRYGYTGRERDPDTGLAYYRARFYDPQLGRFISEDPIGFAGGINQFGYVASNPLGFVDPQGLDIVVIENGPTRGNPFGHTAIAISGYGVFTFGNGNPNVPGQNIIGGSLWDYILRELTRRSTTIYIIRTTPDQDRQARDALLAMDSEPPLEGGLSLAVDDCSSRVNRALDAAGIPQHIDRHGPLPPSVPGTAGERAADAQAEIIRIMQNSNLVSGDKRRLREFEPKRRVPKPGAPGGTPVDTMPMMRKRKGCGCR